MTTKEFQERSDLRIFLSYFKPHKKLFVLDMVCALTIALIDLAFPYLSRWCMYELLPQNAYRTFFTVMAVAAAAFAVRGVLTYIIGYYGHTFGILVEADIRRDLFRHMQELDFGYYDRNRTGALMSRLTSELFEITELAHPVSPASARQRPSPTRRRNWRSSMSPMTFIKPPRRNFIRRWADSTA